MKRKNFSTSIDEVLLKKFKILCIAEGKKINEKLEEIINEYLTKKGEMKMKYTKLDVYWTYEEKKCEGYIEFIPVKEGVQIIATSCMNNHTFYNEVISEEMAKEMLIDLKNANNNLDNCPWEL